MVDSNSLSLLPFACSWLYFLFFWPAVGCAPRFAQLLQDLVVGLNRHVAGQVGILVRDLHDARVIGSRGRRRGALQVGVLTAVSPVRARRGPHDWGSSWEGLTQTRRALLPAQGALRVWAPKSRGPRGVWVFTGGGSNCCCWCCSYQCTYVIVHAKCAEKCACNR